jgi:starch phosphorylase
MSQSSSAADLARRAPRVAALERAIEDHITHTLALDRSVASERDVYMSTAQSIRDQLAERWAATQRAYHESDAKRVYYLSLEFLLGRTLGNALINLGLEGPAAEALEQMGYRLEELAEREPERVAQQIRTWMRDA